MALFGLFTEWLIIMQPIFGFIVSHIFKRFTTVLCDLRVDVGIW